MKDENDPFLVLRGIFRDEFRALGGGESFIRNEREEFSRETDELDKRIEESVPKWRVPIYLRKR